MTFYLKNKAAPSVFIRHRYKCAWWPTRITYENGDREYVWLETLYLTEMYDHLKRRWKVAFVEKVSLA